MNPRGAATTEIERIVRAEDSDPFQFLGPHWIDRDGQTPSRNSRFRPGATGSHDSLGPRRRLRGRSNSTPADFSKRLFAADLTRLREDQTFPRPPTTSYSISPTATRSKRSTRTPFLPCSPITISISRAKARTTKTTKNLARTCAKSRESAACTSPCGRRTRSA